MTPEMVSLNIDIYLTLDRYVRAAAVASKSAGYQSILARVW